MGQARYGSGAEYGRIIKSDYDPTLETPKRFTRSDKQLAGGVAAGGAGVGYLVGAQRWPAAAATQRKQAVANVSMAHSKLNEHKAKINSMSRTGNNPFHWGFDRDRPGGPLKNAVNRRRLNRQTPRLERNLADAKRRVTVANEAAKRPSIKARQMSMRTAGGVLATGGGYLMYRGLKNRKMESEAGLR